MKVSVGIPDLKNGIILVVTVTGSGDNPSGFKHFSTFGRKMDGLDLPPGPLHAIVANESVGWLGSLLVVTGCNCIQGMVICWVCTYGSDRNYLVNCFISPNLWDLQST